jgi:hypothetical protein
MMTAEEVDSLSIGDLVEIGTIFPLLGDEPLVMRTAERNPDGATVFVVTYFGITVGRWEATKNEGGLSWKFG